MSVNNFESQARYYSNLPILTSTEKNKLAENPVLIDALYGARKNFATVISQNILFSAYPEITKIENDMFKYKDI